MTNTLQNIPGSEVKFEKKSTIQGEFKIKVPGLHVTKRMETAFQNLQKTAKLPGFRPGKVPMDLLRKKYRGDVLSDVFNKVIMETYRGAAIEQKIPVVGDPQVTNSNWLVWDENKHFEFTAQVELIPEVSLKKYKGLPITKKDAKIKDEDVEIVIKNLLDPRAEIVNLEEGTKIQKGHFIILDFKGSLDGAPLADASADNFMLEVGTDKNSLPDFDNGLIGMKAGEEKTIQVKYPADFANPEIAGKKVAYAVKIHEIKKKNYPELTDELAKEFQAESVAELHKKIRESLEAELSAEQEQKTQEELLLALIEANPMEVPQSLIQRQIHLIVEDVTRLLKRQQFKEPMIEDYFKKHFNELKARAEREVKLALLLPQVVGTEKIEASDADLKTHLAKVAKGSGQTVEQLEKMYFSDKERKEDLRRDVQRYKALDLMTETAKAK